MKYKKIYKYLNSSDLELKSLAIGLIDNSKAKNFISYIYGYKLEYIIKYYYDVISKLPKDSYLIIDGYFSIVSEIIVELNFPSSRRNLVKAILSMEGKIHSIDSYSKLFILVHLFKYSKFFRKHKRKTIIIYNREISLEFTINIIENSIYTNRNFNALYLYYFFEILKTFKNDN